MLLNISWFITFIDFDSFWFQFEAPVNWGWCPVRPSFSVDFSILVTHQVIYYQHIFYFNHVFMFVYLLTLSTDLFYIFIFTLIVYFQILYRRITVIAFFIIYLNLLNLIINSYGSLYHFFLYTVDETKRLFACIKA